MAVGTLLLPGEVRHMGGHDAGVATAAAAVGQVAAVNIYCMRSRWAPIAACWWITARAMCCSNVPSKYLYGLRKSNA